MNTVTQTMTNIVQTATNMSLTMQILIGIVVGIIFVILMLIAFRVSLFGIILKFGFLSDPANPKRYYFATEVEENTAKIRVKGKKLDTMYFQSQTHRFNGSPVAGEKWGEWNIVERGPDDEPNYFVLTGWKRKLFDKTGIWWVGFIFLRLHRYVLGYTKVRMLEDGTTKVYGKENISEHVVCYPQEIILEGRFEKVETKDQIKVSGPFTVTIVVMNPARWAFIAQPVIQTLNAIVTHGRNYIGNHTYDQMFGNEDAPSHDESSSKVEQAPDFKKSMLDVDKERFGDFLREAFMKKLPGDGTPNGALLKLGVSCSRVNVKDLDMDDPEAEAARTAAYRAEKQGQAKVVERRFAGLAQAEEATGQATAIRTLADARAAATIKQARADKTAVLDMANEDVVFELDAKGQVVRDENGEPKKELLRRTGLGVDKAFENQQRRISADALKEAGAVYTPLGANLIIGPSGGSGGKTPPEKPEGPTPTSPKPDRQKQQRHGKEK